MSDYDAFAPIYDDWSAHMTEDVAWYVGLAQEADGPVVELAVGNGRVAVPVARATGIATRPVPTASSTIGPSASCASPTYHATSSVMCADQSS